MALEDNLAATIVKPVHVGFLDFKNDPVRGWTGPGLFLPSGTGDSDLDGQTFSNVAGAVTISDFAEGRGIGEPVKITFAAGNQVDEEVFQQLVVDQREFMARRVKIWLFFLNADESSVLADYTVLFNGVMVGAELSRQPGQPATVIVSCDADLKAAENADVFWTNHQRFYPSDTGSVFINHIGTKATVIVPTPIPSGPPDRSNPNPRTGPGGRDFPL